MSNRGKNQIVGSRNKPCPKCGRPKNDVDFKKRGGKLSHLYRSYCNPCADKRAAEWNRNNPVRVRRNNLLSGMKRFGTALSFLPDAKTVERMESSHHGKCAICGSEQVLGKKNRLDADHDHTNGFLRGFICNLCNQGLGQFKDSPVVLRRAADYLERNWPLEWSLTEVEAKKVTR